VADLALERKALNVVVIDLRERSTYTDFLIIASGTSDRHVQAIVEHIDASLTKSGIKALGTEGVREGQWALVDFGSIVVHVFHQYTRQVYDLEAMWRDAPCLHVDPDATLAQEATH
jgi:ribosome-associated protein